MNKTRLPSGRYRYREVEFQACCVAAESTRNRIIRLDKNQTVDNLGNPSRNMDLMWWASTIS